MKLKIAKNMMKKNYHSKWMSQLFVALLLCCGWVSVLAQPVVVKTDIFKVVYSEHYQQPLQVNYTVECPFGEAGRSGIQWYGYDGVTTSDLADYQNNVWDRGHLAPAADFSCDKETIKKTFTYLNCALQHEGLNRGPWKELERFERDLAKIYYPEDVTVEVEVLFLEEETWLPTGALIPSGFRKRITTPQGSWLFEFPNEDVAGQDWSNFRVY